MREVPEELVMVDLGKGAESQLAATVVDESIECKGMDVEIVQCKGVGVFKLATKGLNIPAADHSS